MRLPTAGRRLSPKPRARPIPNVTQRIRLIPAWPSNLRDPVSRARLRLILLPIQIPDFPGPCTPQANARPIRISSTLTLYFSCYKYSINSGPFGLKLKYIVE